jgi:predicted RNA binding protein YcfA (HicA-like mRNA interferase family)
MKIPRDLSGKELAKALHALGYEITRQTGSHIRLSTNRNGEHHLTIPAHSPLKVGTLSAILGEIQNHHQLTRDDLLSELFF